MSRARPANRADLSHENICFATTERFIYLDGKLSCKGSVTYRFCRRETSYGRWRVGGLAPVTFLGEKSWKISIV